MNAQRLLTLSLLLSGCGIDQLEFRSLDAEGRETDPTSSGSGGAENRTLPLVRGGFAGGLSTTLTYGTELDWVSDPGCDGLSLSSAEAESCVAGSVCAALCAGAGDSVAYEFEGRVLAAECRNIVKEPGWFYEGPDPYVAVIPCDSDVDCGPGLICAPVATDYGKMCLIPETPFAPQCTDEYCGGEPGWSLITGSASRFYYCDVDFPCCEGNVCAPSGECERRSCLPQAYACDETKVDCCDGLTCVEGTCR